MTKRSWPGHILHSERSIAQVHHAKSMINIFLFQLMCQRLKKVTKISKSNSPQIKEVLFMTHHLSSLASSLSSHLKGLVLI
ncbi:U4 putative protein [Burg el Arab virus]|uniref:Uncharacterized protein n=1 Tax=Burg el Arab virus TaxID=2686073 RepID=A0AAE8XBN4_9RHAB|nr:U4 putative protein [Burg el Arab virus]UAU42901.1 U4 putative protein [Burg el Arab virus]